MTDKTTVITKSNRKSYIQLSFYQEIMLMFHFISSKTKKMYINLSCTKSIIQKSPIFLVSKTYKTTPMTLWDEFQLWMLFRPKKFFFLLPSTDIKPNNVRIMKLISSHPAPAHTSIFPCLWLDYCFTARNFNLFT